MKIKRFLRLIILLWSFGAPGRASTVVHDPIHTVLNVAQQVYGQIKQEAQHAEDITKYTTMIQKQLQQINQLTNIVNQDVEQLRRFGNPDTYVNMLGLEDLFEEVNKVKTGVGRTVADFTETANGIAALEIHRTRSLPGSERASRQIRAKSSVPDRKFQEIWNGARYE